MTRFLVDGKEYAHIWYVYTLAYPDGTVFYVGKGQGKRVNQSSERSRKSNWEKQQTITAIEYQGHRVSKRIIATFELEQHAFVYESMLMESYGLANLTNVHYSTSRRTFIKPHPIQTVDAEISPKGKLIDLLTYERITVQPWEAEKQEENEETEDEEQSEQPEDTTLQEESEPEYWIPLTRSARWVGVSSTKLSHMAAQGKIKSKSDPVDGRKRLVDMVELDRIFNPRD